MSGAGRQKGDIRTPRWLIEDKVSDASGFRISLFLWHKIEREARSTGRLPQMRLTLQGVTLRVMAEADYLSLIDE